MRKSLIDILACPIDKHYPLQLLTFKEEEDIIVDGALICTDCHRFYPIVNEIPIMLPDDLRDAKGDSEFIAKWGDRLPQGIRLTHHT